MFESVHPNVLTAIICVFAFLVIATVVVLALGRVKPDWSLDEVRQRTRTWWIMAAIFAVGLTLSDISGVVFFGLLSFLALKEYLSIIETRRADRRVLFWAYLAIPLQYYWIGTGWYGMAIIFIPVYMFLFLPLRMIMIGETKGFLRSAGIIQWGLMTTVFCLGHVAMLLTLPSEGNVNGGGAALMFFLVVLTQVNDVAQFLFGKWLGRRKIVPTVSQGKTWAGFIGGACSTVALTFLLGPWLTPFEGWSFAAVGLIIGVGGFVGDVIISAVKRDLNLKDSGSLLPGHGGILDRLDSLMYTAPLFYHFTRYFYY